MQDLAPFYTPPQDSCRVYGITLAVCVCLSVFCMSIRLYFCLQMITLINVNGFSPSLVCALILWKSALELLMGKIYQFLTELSAQDMSEFSFIFSTISSISFLPFSGRQHKVTHKGWRVVKPQYNQSINPEEANWSGSALFVIQYVNFCQQSISCNLIGWQFEVGMASWFIQHDKG